MVRGAAEIRRSPGPYATRKPVETRPTSARRRRAGVGAAEDLHQSIRISTGLEAELTVEPVGVAREERPAPEPLKLGMRQDRRHEALAHTPSATRRRHEHVADVRERRVVGDHAREPDLLLT